MAATTASQAGVGDAVQPPEEDDLAGEVVDLGVPGAAAQALPGRAARGGQVVAAAQQVAAALPVVLARW